MTALIYIIAFIFVLSIIIFVHELGHFLAAKKFGVFCGEFSIGMGPVLYRIMGKETQYSLRLLPVGGFVSMAGEKDDTKKSIEVPFEKTINGIRTWKKIVVMSSGIVMNLLLAWIILVGLNMYTGSIQKPAKPIFEVVEDGSIADKAGFKDGDIILNMVGEDNKTIIPETFDTIRETINIAPQMYIFEVKRGNHIMHIRATPKADENGAYRLGVSTSVSREKIEWYEAFHYGTKDFMYSLSLIFKSFSLLLNVDNIDQLSGPVGILKITGVAVDAGVPTLFHLIALLSLNIGIFNAVPIPILDGGRIFITLMEKLLKRNITDKVLKGAMLISAIFLITLMIVSTINDFIRLL